MTTSSKTTAWAMWAIASIFYAYQYILRVMPNVMMQDIMAKYHIDPSVFGQFSGVYYIGYSLIHMPLGILLDRFGPKKIMPIFMIFTVIGMAPLVFSDFWVYPIVGRALIGIGSSSAILGVFKIIRMSFNEGKFAWMLSLSVTIGLLGAIYGGAPIHYLREAFGFEQVVVFLMIGGVALSVLTYLVIPNTQSVGTSQSVMKNIATVFGSARVISICVLAGFMVGPLEGFADVWGTTFLKRVYGLQDGVAASLPSMMFFGMCFGGPALSLIAQKTKSYLGVIAACALLMGLAFVMLITSTPSATTLSVVFFVVGMLCAYQILAIAFASTCVPKEVAGLTSAVANMIIMIFGYIFHALIGATVGVFNTDTGGQMSAESLKYGVSVIPIALFVAAVGFLILTLRRIKERHSEATG